jgi:hypothetical protein
MTKSLNCWDFMKCGFGPDDRRTDKQGVCPAVRENTLDGVHGGSHGGRACWFVNNTLDCGHGVQGDFNAKYPVCMNCGFYWTVRQEEGKNFAVSLLLNAHCTTNENED